MTELPPNVTDEGVRELRAHIGKRIAFNAGKNRMVGKLLDVDRFLNLKVLVTDGRETGIHRLRLGRMANYALLDTVEPNNGTTKTKKA